MQPRSGLDLEAQQLAVERMMDNGKTRHVAQFVEQEPEPNRPALAAAIELCRQKNARLLIAKMGRLRQSLEFLSVLQDSRVRYMAVDMPEANALNTHLMIQLEKERRQGISKKVKGTLRELRVGGLQMGGDTGNRAGLQLGPAASALARNQSASMRARRIMWAINDVQRDGRKSLREIAKQLEARNIHPPKGGSWSAAQVRAVILRCESSGFDAQQVRR